MGRWPPQSTIKNGCTAVWYSAMLLNAWPHCRIRCSGWSGTSPLESGRSKVTNDQQNHMFFAYQLVKLSHAKINDETWKYHLAHVATCFENMFSKITPKANSSRALIIQQLLETMLPGRHQARLLEDFLAYVDLTICHKHHAHSMSYHSLWQVENHGKQTSRPCHLCQHPSHRSQQLQHGEAM